MHEASITEAIVEQARGLVPPETRLMRCVVEVGELEHLDSEVMSRMWAAMTQETELGGAALEVERVALRVRCAGCGEEFRPEDRAVLRCPSCGDVRPELLAGAGVTLRSLEVEENG